MNKLLMVKEENGTLKYFIREDDIFEGYFLKNDILIFSLMDEDEEIELQEKYEGDIIEFANENTVIGNYLESGIRDSEEVEDYFGSEYYGLIDETKEGITDLEEYFNEIEKINYIANKNEDIILDDLISEEPIELEVLGFSKDLKLNDNSVLTAEEGNHWALLEDSGIGEYLIIKAPTTIDSKVELNWTALKEIYYIEYKYNELNSCKFDGNTDNIYIVLDEEETAKNILGISEKE